MKLYVNSLVPDFSCFVYSYFPTMKNSDKTLPRTPKFSVLGRFCMSFLFIRVCS